MSEIHGATGAYALNALDPAELDEFEAHLASCAACRREVAEFRETATDLTLLAAAVPPPELRASILAAVGGVRVLPPELPAQHADHSADPVAQAAPVDVGSTGNHLSTGNAGNTGDQGDPVDELARRRQARTTRLLSLAVAAVMVVALGLGGWVVTLLQREPPVATATLETELLRAPDLKAYTVDLKNGGKATFVASRGLNRAMLSGDLPALREGQTYQLWTLAGPLTAPTRVTPDALVGGGNAVKQWFTGPIAQSDAVAISIEQAGGAAAPTDVQGAAAL